MPRWTRQLADTFQGASLNVTIGHPAEVRAGARSLRSPTWTRVPDRPRHADTPSRQRCPCQKRTYCSRKIACTNNFRALYSLLPAAANWVARLAVRVRRLEIQTPNWSRFPGRYRSGQTGQTVNLLAYAFSGSNPLLPIAFTRAASAIRADRRANRPSFLRCIFRPNPSQFSEHISGLHTGFLTSWDGATRRNTVAICKYHKSKFGKTKSGLRISGFRDLYLERLFDSVNSSYHQRCSKLNRRIPAVKQMVALADISAFRDWTTPFPKTQPLLNGRNQGIKTATVVTWAFCQELLTDPFRGLLPYVQDLFAIMIAALNPFSESLYLRRSFSR